MSADPVPSLGHVLDFLRLIWAVSHGLQSTSKRMERRIGLTGPQRLVIRLLEGAPGSSAGSLARILHVHPSTLTGVLRRLEHHGLIDRTTAPGDRRRAQLSVTRRGRRLGAHMSGTAEAAVASTLATVAPADIVAARAVLTLLASLLNAPAATARRAPLASPARRPGIRPRSKRYG